MAFTPITKQANQLTSDYSLLWWEILQLNFNISKHNNKKLLVCVI